MKTVNSAGRDLIDDFKDSIAESPPAKLSSFCNYYTKAKDKCEAKGSSAGLEFVYQQFYTKDIRNNTVANGTSDNANPLPYGGVFCTGKYSYIWRTGYTMNSEFYEKTNGSFTGLTFAYKDKNNVDRSINNFRLLKIEDNSRKLCLANVKTDVDASGGNVYGTLDSDSANPNYLKVTQHGGTITYPDKLSTDPVEFLSSSDSSLALFSLAIYPPAQTTTTGKTLYSSSFILATISGGVNIMTNSNFCSTLETSPSDFSYCAINKFNFSMQANGG